MKAHQCLTDIKRHPGKPSSSLSAFRFSARTLLTPFGLVRATSTCPPASGRREDGPARLIAGTSTLAILREGAMKADTSTAADLGRMPARYSSPSIEILKPKKKDDINDLTDSSGTPMPPLKTIRNGEPLVPQQSLEPKPVKGSLKKRVWPPFFQRLGVFWR